MRKTKSFRFAESSAFYLKELAARYECNETNVLEALIISRYQIETSPGPLSFGEILDIIR